MLTFQRATLSLTNNSGWACAVRTGRPTNKTFSEKCGTIEAEIEGQGDWFFWVSEYAKHNEWLWFKAQISSITYVSCCVTWTVAFPTIWLPLCLSNINNQNLIFEINCILLKPYSTCVQTFPLPQKKSSLLPIFFSEWGGGDVCNYFCINFTLQMETSHTWRTGAATTARRLRTHSSKMASFTTSVISRANALALQGYKHCCHVMLHCPVEEKLFGFYPVKHAVLVSTVYTRKLGWYIYF